MARKMLGDLIESALTSVGITHELVEKYVWDCGCKRRKARFNEIHRWAEQHARGLYDNVVSAKDDLLRVIDPSNTKTDL